MAILQIRKLADKTEGTRVVRFDPATGEKKLVNPETPGDAHEAWPLAGIEFIGEVPTETALSTDMVTTGRGEGWLELVGEDVVHKPGGPSHSPWAVTHTFVTAEQIVFKTVHGDVTYNVTKNPGKYENERGAEVIWFYQLELASDETTKTAGTEEAA